MTPDNAEKLSELFTELLSPFVDGLTQDNIKPEVYTLKADPLSNAPLIRRREGVNCSEEVGTHLNFEKIEIPHETIEALSSVLKECTRTWISRSSGHICYHGTPENLEEIVEIAKPVIQNDLRCALQ